jgi:hypothetical protein
MMKNMENKALRPKKNKQVFFYPDYGISVEAESREEADKKVLAKKKKK